MAALLASGLPPRSPSAFWSRTSPASKLFLGVNDPASSSFTLAAEGAKGKNNTVLTGFSRMITTRGSAYCFLPSLSGLRYLARLPAASGSR